MTRRRWIADEVSGNHAALVGDHARHLVRVLRARVGQEFDIVAGASIRRGRIANISDDRVEFDLGEEVTAALAANLTCCSPSSSSTASNGRLRSVRSLA